MTRYTIFAKRPERIPELRAIAEARGFVYDEGDPEFMITLGGDGTFLLAEQRFPGVPKLLVRDSFLCFKCHNEPVSDMLELVRGGRSLVVEIPKLRAAFDTAAPLATNDIAIRNTDPRHALRYRLAIEGEPIDDILIGDGIVVATPFGSTGYFHSVTGATIPEGIGVGFNNPTRSRRPLVLDEHTRIALTVVRGDAHLTADNHPELSVLHEGDTVTIAKAREVGRLIGHD